MRCPHCASLSVSPPTCLTCGRNIDAPTEQEKLPGLILTNQGVDVDVPVATMPGLETTRQHDTGQEVPVERMPGLITHEEVLGDTRIPDDGAPNEGGPRVCPRCGADAGEEKLCPRCGYLVLAKNTSKDVGKKPNDDGWQTCLECGVPNRADRAKCLACGSKM